ncbi:hypothetical protein V5P93_004846 [Actinokineospora auranticolor]|uniref:T4 beta protein n=1 Tax=Actinokineospora auranticolor TaxID=155976 RepID=A0A2S6GNK2_9PSEU|nr:hypothetical protein [Actinokineospora auranticolor]PPK66808.1 T4 beta protein [Actinokineospora auranticolor]
MRFVPLVVLKSKVGEFGAVMRLGAGHAPRILVELLDSVRIEGGRLLPMFTEAAVQMAERGQPVWVDVRAMGGARFPGGSFAFLDDHIESTLDGQLSLDVPAIIPVVHDNASDSELAAVALLQQHRPRDVVIRFHDLAPACLDDRLRRVVRGSRAKGVHAVIDLGYVDDARPESVVPFARALVDRLGPAAVTVLAGSIPAKRNGYTTTTRARPELALWQAVSDEVPVHYGDYGVVHPAIPPPSTPGKRSVHPYLYYTTPGHVVALRRPLEKAVERAAAAGFADLASELVARKDFAGTAFSWGDRELSGCRRGGVRGASTTSTWVAMATSHHVAHLTRRGPSEW